MNINQQLSKHLQRFFGDPELVSKAKHPVSGEAAGFSIARYADVPAEDAAVLSTLGLSDQIVTSEEGDIRQELIVCCWRNLVNDKLYQRLFNLAQYIAEEKAAIPIGTVFDLEEPLLQGSPLQGILFFAPVYFPEEFFYLTEVDPTVEFLWAIPITQAEMDFIEIHGVDAFDVLLEEHDPDLMDFHRDSIV